MYIKYNNKNYQNNENLKEILNVSGEILNDENCIKVTESMVSIPFDEKNKVLFDISQNKIILKTDNQLKLEKLNKLQGQILNKLKDINIAIATQQATNKLLLENGENEIYTISKEDIITIGQYQNLVATFHQTWNPDDYILEEINESIFNQELILPEIVTRL